MPSKPASSRSRKRISQRSGDEPYPTQQRRSAETVERLLDASEALLANEGVEAATLRAIAERAGVSIGIVYRRFRDKDAVLRAVYARFFSRIRAGNRRALDRMAAQRLETPALLNVIVHGVADGYRRHRDLLRTLVLYVRTHPDEAFRTRARALNAAVYEDVYRLLVTRRPDVSRSNRRVAVALAISTIAATLQERILFEDVTALPAMSQNELIEEMTRMIRNYLSE
jgi:AcrR family transcriptional regulator